MLFSRKETIMKISVLVVASVLVHATVMCGIHEEHFATLNLQPSASTDQIKTRCAQLRNKTHPDPHNDTGDAVQYQKVTRACAALKNIHALVPVSSQENHFQETKANNSTESNAANAQPAAAKGQERTFSVQNNFNSIVYDLPLRRSSLLYNFYDGPCERKSWLSLAGVGFGRSFTQERPEHTVFGGVIGSWRDFADRFWIELRTAVLSQHIRDDVEVSKEKKDKNHFGLDDIVVTMGYDPINEAGKYVSVYGLVGIPTHRKRIFDGDLAHLVGTGTVNVGGGLDAENEFFSTDDYSFSFFSNIRVLYRLPAKMARSAHSEKAADQARLAEDVDFANLTTAKSVTPEEDKVTFHAGGIADVLIGGQFRLGSHCFELGYDPTIPFGFKLVNCLDSELKLEGKALHKVYLSYSYAMHRNNGNPLMITAGLSRAMGREGDFRSLGGWLSLAIGF